MKVRKDEVLHDFVLRDFAFLRRAARRRAAPRSFRCGAVRSMNYHLRFLVNDTRIAHVYEAAIETEHLAICWMWLVGAVWARQYDGHGIELRQGRCVARIPARSLGQAGASEVYHRPRPIILIVLDENSLALSYEDIAAAAGCSVGASFSSCAPAGEWLDVHSPDAAIIDVNIQDGGSIPLVDKLSVREIPFLVVSSYPGGSPGIDRIYWSVPRFEKPVTVAELQHGRHREL